MDSPREQRIPARSTAPMTERAKTMTMGEISRTTALVATNETPQKTTARKAPTSAAASSETQSYTIVAVNAFAKIGAK
jgi:hypothetical protein